MVSLLNTSVLSARKSNNCADNSTTGVVTRSRARGSTNGSVNNNDSNQRSATNETNNYYNVTQSSVVRAYQALKEIVTVYNKGRAETLNLFRKALPSVDMVEVPHNKCKVCSRNDIDCIVDPCLHYTVWFGPLWQKSFAYSRNLSLIFSPKKESALTQ